MSTERTHRAPRRPDRPLWSAEELAYLRAHADSAPPVVARELRRSITAVWNKRRELRIAKQYAEYGPEFDAFLREHHAAGWSDADVAEAWGGHRKTVGKRRRQLGLPKNAHNARHRAKQRELARRQCADLGVKSLGEMRRMVYRLEAHRRGWPEDCTPLMCDILDVLERGSATRREICEQLGKRWTGCKAMQTGGGKSAVQQLVRMGRLVRLGRRPYAPGSGRTRFVYGFADGFKRAKRMAEGAA